MLRIDEAELKELFDLFDLKHEGKVLLSDIKTCLLSIVQKKKIKNPAEVYTIFKLLEEYEKQELTFTEFSDLLNSSSINFTNTKSLSHDQILHLWTLVDVDKRGKIGFRELALIAAELEYDISSAELYEIVKYADFDGDGLISFDEFARIMHSRLH